MLLSSVFQSVTLYINAGIPRDVFLRQPKNSRIEHILDIMNQHRQKALKRTSHQIPVDLTDHHLRGIMYHWCFIFWSSIYKGCWCRHAHCVVVVCFWICPTECVFRPAGNGPLLKRTCQISRQKQTQW